MMMESDVSDVLPAVRVPTVVLSRATNRDEAAYFAERISGARLVELPVQSIYHWLDEDSRSIAMLETRRLVDSARAEPARDRVLATILLPISSVRPRARRRSATRVGASSSPHRSTCRGSRRTSDVLVSQTVKDLVAGSGIEFEDRGRHELKGVPGEWRLYAVARV
jgi:hypothetical protein